MARGNRVTSSNNSNESGGPQSSYEPANEREQGTQTMQPYRKPLPRKKGDRDGEKKRKETYKEKWKDHKKIAFLFYFIFCLVGEKR